MGYGASWASASKQWSWCSSSVPAFDDSVFDSSGCSERVYFPHRSPVQMATCSLDGTAHTMAVMHDCQCQGDSLQWPYTSGADSR